MAYAEAMKDFIREAMRPSCSFKAVISELIMHPILSIDFKEVGDFTRDLSISPSWLIAQALPNAKYYFPQDKKLWVQFLKEYANEYPSVEAFAQSVLADAATGEDNIIVSQLPIGVTSYPLLINVYRLSNDFPPQQALMVYAGEEPPEEEEVEFHYIFLPENVEFKREGYHGVRIPGFVSIWIGGLSR